MQTRFFDRALASAKEGPEALAAVFESKDADPNARKYGLHGVYLIH